MKKYKTIYKTSIGYMLDGCINNWIDTYEKEGWTLDVIHSKFIAGAESNKEATNIGNYPTVLIFYKKELIKTDEK